MWLIVILFLLISKQFTSIVLNVFSEMVAERIDNGEFFVESQYDDINKLSKLNAIHIFPLGKEFCLHEQQKLHYVLAPTDLTGKTYLPAEVMSLEETNPQRLVVEFINGIR